MSVAAIKAEVPNIKSFCILCKKKKKCNPFTRFTDKEHFH